MSTTAKLVVNPAEGHGLTPQITDSHFASAVRGEPVPHVLALVKLKQVGFGEAETAQGKHRHVKYEVIKCEPVLDGGQASELEYTLLALYESRTSTGDQQTLPLGFPGQADEEKRLALMERMEVWAGEESMTGGELEAAWRSHFGIGPDEDTSFGDRGVPGDYRKASVAFLFEFADAVGAVGGDHDADDEDEASDLDDETESDGP